MAESALKNRRRKNEVITIDNDDVPDQKAKTAKIDDEESVPSAEVLELREKLRETEEKLLKSEDNFQRMCRTAREHELRAERAENLLDSKRGVLEAMKSEELEKKLSSLMNQLEEEREERKVTSEKMAELTNQLAEERSKSMRWMERYSKLLDAEKNEELQKKMADLTNQLEQEKIRAVDSDEREKSLSNQLEAERHYVAEYRARNDELSSHLAKFDVWLAQLQQTLPPLQQLLQIPAANEQLQQIQDHLGVMHQYHNCIKSSAAALSSPVEKIFTISETAHPTNILQMLRAGTMKSVGLDSAVGKLLAKYIECGAEKWKRVMMASNEPFECSACDKIVPKREVLGHFLSQSHTEKVRAHGATVSLDAYQHWFRLLQQAAAPDAAAAIPVLIGTGRC